MALQSETETGKCNGNIEIKQKKLILRFSDFSGFVDFGKPPPLCVGAFGADPVAPWGKGPRKAEKGQGKPGKARGGGLWGLITPVRAL